MRAVEKKFHVRLSANHERNKLDATVEIEHLFSYGTLQLEEVQLETFGRKLDGQPDALLGYRLAMITITDEAFVVKSGTANHRNLQFTGNSSDVLEGMVFKVTTSELEQADAYEPEGYERVKVELRSGINAWVFVYSGKADQSL